MVVSFAFGPTLSIYGFTITISEPVKEKRGLTVDNFLVSRIKRLVISFSCIRPMLYFFRIEPVLLDRHAAASCLDCCKLLVSRQSDPSIFVHFNSSRIILLVVSIYYVTFANFVSCFAFSLNYIFLYTKHLLSPPPFLPTSFQLLNPRAIHPTDLS